LVHFFHGSHLKESAEFFIQFLGDLRKQERVIEARPRWFAAMTKFGYDASRILAIAATCLSQSRVSLLSLFRPRSVNA